MKQIRIVLLITLLLLPASHLGAREAYSAEVCNKGQLSVDVAVAYTAFGAIDEYWIIDGWYVVLPGKCRTVFVNLYEDNWREQRSFPTHLAFAFTDSTGVWGAANVQPPRNVAASRLQLCVTNTRQNFKYRVEAKDPATACKGQPNFSLIRASIDHEPKNPDYVAPVTRESRPGLSATVALGPNDRAIPLGPQASTGGAAAGAGTMLDLHEVLKGIMRGPDAPKPRISGEYSLEVCVPPTVVEKESWANPSTARAKAFSKTVRQFLASHTFSNVSGGTVLFRVTETGSNNFMAEEVRVCSGDFEFGLWNHHQDKQRATAPPPAAKPAPKAAPEPAPGFGDLIGPGGFIKPPSK